jgi:hypothetical protein
LKCAGFFAVLSNLLTAGFCQNEDSGFGKASYANYFKDNLRLRKSGTQLSRDLHLIDFYWHGSNNRNQLITLRCQLYPANVLLGSKINLNLLTKIESAIINTVFIIYSVCNPTEMQVQLFRLIKLNCKFILIKLNCKFISIKLTKFIELCLKFEYARVQLIEYFDV